MQKTWFGIILVAYKTNPTRILLVENTKSGNISPVSGALEDSENHLDALLREAKEEVNWDIDSSKVKQTNIEYSFIFGSNKPERAGDKGQYKVFLYNADLQAEPQTTKDTKSPVWISKNEVLSKIKFDDLKEVLAKALDSIT